MAAIKPRNQKQVLAGLDLLNGRRIRRLSKSHDRGIATPIRAAVAKARSNKELLRKLGKTLFAEMDSTALENAMADGMVQSALIGRVAAMPKGKSRKVETSKRQNRGTKGRRDEGARALAG